MTQQSDNSNGWPGPRRGFSVMELLVVVAVIGICTAMFTVALLSAQERVRVDKTKDTIAKLNTLVMAKWDSYKTRRIPLPPATVVNSSGAVVPTFNTPSTSSPSREYALARLDYLREMMRMEMPERFTDIFDDPVLPDPAAVAASGKTYASWNAMFTDSIYNSIDKKVGIPSVTYAYRAALAADGITSLASVTDRVAWNQSAECLYLWITMGLEGATSRELFTDDEIRDTDIDGLLEFVDGWGRPICFLRWAPGFVADAIQSGSTITDRTGFVSALQSKDADSNGNVRDPDPFDVMRVDTRSSANNNLRVPQSDSNARYVNYALYPLVYSSGQDKAYGIVDGILGNNATTAGSFHYSTTASLSSNGAPNDPYVTFGGSVRMGTPKRQTVINVQGNDYALPNRPTVNGTVHMPGIGETIEGMAVEEGDFSDNIHNQAEMASRQ